MLSDEKYEEAIEQRDAAQKIITQYHKEGRERFDARLKSGEPFTDDELRYAATQLCPCGHGMAYPEGCGPGHYWSCSAILKGVADASVEHRGDLPFSFYNVKSEGQPSARGATTRGVFKPQKKEDPS